MPQSDIDSIRFDTVGLNQYFQTNNCSDPGSILVLLQQCWDSVAMLCYTLASYQPTNASSETIGSSASE